MEYKDGEVIRRLEEGQEGNAMEDQFSMKAPSMKSPSNKSIKGINPTSNRQRSNHQPVKMQQNNSKARQNIINSKALNVNPSSNDFDEYQSTLLFQQNNQAPSVRGRIFEDRPFTSKAQSQRSRYPAKSMQSVVSNANSNHQHTNHQHNRNVNNIESIEVPMSGFKLQRKSTQKKKFAGPKDAPYRGVRTSNNIAKI